MRSVWDAGHHTRAKRSLHLLLKSEVRDDGRRLGNDAAAEGSRVKSVRGAAAHLFFPLGAPRHSASDQRERRGISKRSGKERLRAGWPDDRMA